MRFLGDAWHGSRGQLTRWCQPGLSKGLNVCRVVVVPTHASKTLVNERTEKHTIAVVQRTALESRLFIRTSE